MSAGKTTLFGTAVSRPSSAGVELFLLGALAFVLPLYEAPKNIFGSLFFILWFFNRVRARDFGGPWRTWDSLIAIALGANVLATAFAGLKGDEWVGLRDVVRTLLLLWCLQRAGYSQKQWVRVLIALLAGTVLAIFGGTWKLHAKGMEGLELHSVGHANHSASYLCIVFGLSLAFLAAYWRALGQRNKLLLLCTVVLHGIAIAATGSRVAVVCMALLTLLIGAMHLRSSWKPLVLAASAIGVAALLMTAIDPWVLRKHVRNLNDDNVLAYRDQLWERAMTAWRAHPGFGIGLDNYPRITTERYRTWTEAQGRNFDPKRNYMSSHAHSLYLDTLAERGIVGSAAMLMFVGAWGVSLWRRRPRPGSVQEEQSGETQLGLTVWGAAAAALFVTLFIGLVNTTLHNEQFAVAMICLGGWLAWCRRQ